MISQCFVEALRERKGKFLIVISTKMKIGRSWEISIHQHFLIGKQSTNDISFYCHDIELENRSFRISRLFDLGNLGVLRMGPVNFFKNYIFEICAFQGKR
jgi:hypothetical protein